MIVKILYSQALDGTPLRIAFSIIYLMTVRYFERCGLAGIIKEQRMIRLIERVMIEEVFGKMNQSFLCNFKAGFFFYFSLQSLRDPFALFDATTGQIILSRTKIGH